MKSLNPVNRTVRNRNHSPNSQVNVSDAASYLIRLTRIPLLSQDEERSLARLAKQGNMEARDKLIESNMRLVVNIARNYNIQLIPFEDLVQEGAIGLLTAVERFDPDRGFRFSTYATHWIRQSIGRAIDNKSKAIRIPSHISDSLRKMERIKLQYIRETGEQPTNEQLAKAMGVPVRKVEMLINSTQEPLSLDMLVGEEENATLSSLLDDINSENPQDAVIQEETATALACLFAVLTPKEAEVMRKRLGFDEEAAQVLQEIGEAMQISRERVRQIEVTALKKLKNAARAFGLRAYLNG